MMGHGARKTRSCLRFAEPLDEEIDFEDWADGGEKWLMSNQGWTYLTPQGGLFAWSGNGRALTGDLIVQLSSDFYHNPELLHDAADVATTQTADNAAATDADMVDSVFAQVNEEDELFVF